LVPDHRRFRDLFRFAICEQGTVYSWGRGRYGALGHDDNETNHMVPARIQGFKRNAIISRIACGRWHSVALANSRELVCWGRNHSGQLGLGFVSRACAKPTAIELEPGERHTPLIHDIAAGEAHTAVVADLNRGSQCEVCLPGEENRVK